MRSESPSHSIKLPHFITSLESVALLLDLPCALLLELRLEPLEDLILLLDLPCALLLDLGVALLLDLPCALLLDLGVALLLDLSCAPLLDWGGSLLLDLDDLLDEDDSGDSVESGRVSTSSLESGRLSTVSGEALDVESESQPTIAKNGMITAATEMILEIPI